MHVDTSSEQPLWPHWNQNDRGKGEKIVESENGYTAWDQAACWPVRVLSPSVLFTISGEHGAWLDKEHYTVVA